MGSRANANSGFVVELGFVGFVVEGKEGVEGGVPGCVIAVVVVFVFVGVVAVVVNVAEDGRWVNLDWAVREHGLKTFRMTSVRLRLRL